MTLQGAKPKLVSMQSSTVAHVKHTYVRRHRSRYHDRASDRNRPRAWSDILCAGRGRNRGPRGHVLLDRDQAASMDAEDSRDAAFHLLVRLTAARRDRMGRCWR